MFTIPPAPDQVRELRAQALDEASNVLVSWRAPANANGELTRYHIYYLLAPDQRNPASSLPVAISQWNSLTVPDFYEALHSCSLCLFLVCK